MQIKVKCVERVGVCPGDTPSFRLTFQVPVPAPAPPEPGKPPTPPPKSPLMLQMGEQPQEVADKFELGRTYTLTLE